MLRRILFACLLAGLLLGQECIPSPDGQDEERPRVTLVTRHGSIVIELVPNAAPNAVASFQQYVEEGYYDDTIFHEVSQGKWIIAGRYREDLNENEAKDLVNEWNFGMRNIRGQVGLYGPIDQDSDEVKPGPAQFLINLGSNTELDYDPNDGKIPDYTIIGQVIEGMDVADLIGDEVTSSQETPDGDTLDKVPAQSVVITEAFVGQPPTADAGEDQTVMVDEEVTLDGSESKAHGGDDELTYEWNQTSGPDVELDDPTSATPSFTPASVGTLVFELTVTAQENGRTDTDSVTVTVNSETNHAPVADAGADRTAGAGTQVTLDGSGSSDPDEDDELSFAWTQTGGTEVELSDPLTASTSFTAPNATDTLTFELAVTDGAGGSATDTITITIVGLPTAEAGSDQIVMAGDKVTLSGSGTGDSPSFNWQETPGHTVTLDDPTKGNPTFTAPSTVVTLTFELAVTDAAGQSATDSVRIRVRSEDNQPPIADAGPDQTVEVGAAVTLDGAASYDPDNGDTPSYAWSQTAGTTVTLTGGSSASATFTAPEVEAEATLAFKLKVTDGRGGSAEDTVSITIPGPFTVSAGPDQIVMLGDEVTLQGSAEGTDAPSFSWVETSGQGIVLSDPAARRPRFTAPEVVTTLTFELTVTDEAGESKTDSASVAVRSADNQPPIADAGDDQTAEPGDTVTLSGWGTDPDHGDTLSFEWSQTEGTAVTLDSPTERTTTFTPPPTAGVLRFRLTVTDNEGGFAAAFVAVTVNTTPTADAGPDQTVTTGELVTLDGSASSDPNEGDTLSFSWVQTDGPDVDLSDASSATPTPTFTAPDTPTTLAFELTVTDTLGESDTASTNVTVRSEDNQPPVADAGEDQNVLAGELVTLAGSGTDPDEGDTLTYAWSQTGGPQVTLSDPAEATTTFTAPASAAVLTFQLTVTDNEGASDDSQVTITVNSPPTANAGESRNVIADLVVTLDGSGSSDPDPGDTLSFTWEQTAGTSVTLSDPTGDRPTFTVPDGVDALTFSLTVDDGHGGTDSASVTLTPVTEPQVRLATSLGDVVLEMLHDDAPITSLNFLQYVEDRFYNGTIFHRVMLGFVVQGGGFLPGLVRQQPERDPIVNEFDPARSNVRGTVAMAKLGGNPDSATCQFFINLEDNSENLDSQNGGFTVFARVVEGMDVIDAMVAVETGTQQDPEGNEFEDVPVEDIVLISATLE